MNKKVTAKIVLTMTLAILAIFVVVVSIDCLDRVTRDREMVADCTTHVEAILRDLTPQRNPLNPALAFVGVSSKMPIGVQLDRLTITDTGGRVIADSRQTGNDALNSDDTSSDPDLVSFLSPIPPSRTVHEYAQWPSGHGATQQVELRAVCDFRDRRQADGAALAMMLEFLVVALAACILGIWFRVYNLVNRPAEAIIRIADRIAGGDRDLRLAVTSGDEFGKIMRAFNNLTDALLTTQQQADTDGLTQLFNHRYIQESIAEAIDHAQRSDGAMAVMLIDLDKFKPLNDTYGHLTGDRFLQQTASVLRRAVHLDEIVGRYGGDEFVVVLPSAPRQRVRAVEARLRDLMQREQFRPSQGSDPIPISFSMGVASYPEHGKTAQQLIAHADASLYNEKAGGLHVVDLNWQKPRDTVTPAWQPGETAGVLAALFALVVAVDEKQEGPKSRSQHVAEWAVRLAGALGLSAETRTALRLAGLLHDIGNIVVPPEILCKDGELSADEFDVIKRHVAFAETIVHHASLPDEVFRAIAHHHERWDGTGYPKGTTGDEAPISARILAIVDAFSAMAHNRPHRSRKTFDEICIQLRGGSGTQFDPSLVEPLIALLELHGVETASECVIYDIADRVAPVPEPKSDARMVG